MARRGRVPGDARRRRGHAGPRARPWGCRCVRGGLEAAGGHRGRVQRGHPRPHAHRAPTRRRLVPRRCVAVRLQDGPRRAHPPRPGPPGRARRGRPARGRRRPRACVPVVRLCRHVPGRIGRRPRHDPGADQLAGAGRRPRDARALPRRVRVCRAAAVDRVPGVPRPPRLGAPVPVCDRGGAGPVPRGARRGHAGGAARARGVGRPRKLPRVLPPARPPQDQLPAVRAGRVLRLRGLDRGGRRVHGVVARELGVGLRVGLLPARAVVAPRHVDAVPQGRRAIPAGRARARHRAGVHPVPARVGGRPRLGRRVAARGRRGVARRPAGRPAAPVPVPVRADGGAAGGPARPAGRRARGRVRGRRRRHRRRPPRAPARLARPHCSRRHQGQAAHIVQPGVAGGDRRRPGGARFRARARARGASAGARARAVPAAPRARRPRLSSSLSQGARRGAGGALVKGLRAARRPRRPA